MDYLQYQLADEDLHELQRTIADRLNTFNRRAHTVAGFSLISCYDDLEYMSFEADLDNPVFMPKNDEKTREQSIHNWAAEIAKTGNGTVSAVEIDYKRGKVSLLVETGITALLQEKAEAITNQEETTHA